MLCKRCYTVIRYLKEELGENNIKRLTLERWMGYSGMEPPI
ncbi:MAG: hypothetical protein ACTSU9_05790 [Promethearchaeota archaeon]